MAERRMFSKAITNSDAFLDMPMSARCLYFHLGMEADDDGFLGSPKRIMRFVGASEDDFKLLLMKHFIIPFESGVCVIKHWNMNNQIQKDRYNASVYTEERSCIYIKKNKSYTLDPTQGMLYSELKNITNGVNTAQKQIEHKNAEMDPKWIQSGSTLETQISIDQYSKEKNNYASADADAESFFESIWKLYPDKKGKAAVSKKSKRELFKLGYDKVKACIDRYVSSKPEWCHYKNGSTFFNSGYLDYLDDDNVSNKNVLSQEELRLREMLRNQ